MLAFGRVPGAPACCLPALRSDEYAPGAYDGVVL